MGEIANKTGRLVEDIIAPAFPEVAKKYFDCEIVDMAERRKKKHPKRKDRHIEIDILVLCDGKVIVNETKSIVRHEYVEKFVKFIKSGEFFEYFPEYEGRELIGIFSSLNIPGEEVRYLTKHGIYALQMGGDYLEIVNFGDVRR